MEIQKLSVTLDNHKIQQAAGKYHFSEQDIPKLQALYQAAEPLLACTACSMTNPGLTGVALEQYVATFVTLGEGLDALQTVYLERGRVSEAYMLECLALELLTEGYTAFAREVQKQQGRYAVRLHFLGDAYPFFLMDEMYRKMARAEQEQGTVAEEVCCGIRFNAQYMMTPKKSVAFLLELQEQPVSGQMLVEDAGLGHARDSLCQVHLAHICETCPNTTCEFRQKQNYTYGYQRIFGHVQADTTRG